MRADSVQRVDRYLTASAERAIEQPGALVPFFEQLLRIGGENAAPVHIIHWGDSHTAADDWTGGLRDLFRERFGDGGSGFSVAGHPFPGYRRFDAHGGGTTLWQTVGGRAGNGDGWFGLGGVGVVHPARRPIRVARYRMRPPGGPLPATAARRPARPLR